MGGRRTYAGWLPGVAEYVLVLAVGWVLFLAAPMAYALDVSPRQPAPEHVTLHLKWMHAFQFAGYYVEKERGYYREEGLDVTINEASPEHKALETVLAGGAEYGVWGSALLNERLLGKPVVVLAAIFQHSPYVVLSRKESGIRMPSDLVGRKVMVDPDMGAVQFKAMLTHEGLSLGDVIMVPHTWRIGDLIQGEVDASMTYITDQPDQMRLQGVEPFIIRPIDYGIDFYGDCLFTTETETAEHPRRVAAFRRASLRGWEYAMSHVEELIDLILALPGVRERGLTREHLRYEAEQMRLLILPNLVEMGHINPGRWKHIADTYVSLGMLDPDYSLKGLIYEPNPPKDYRWFFAVLGGLTGIIFVAVLAWIWNWQLRQAVVRRTQELRQSEKRLRAIFEDSPIAIWEEDFSQVNARLQELRLAGVNDLGAYLDENPGEVARLAVAVRVLDTNRASLRVFGVESKEEMVGDLPRHFTAESLKVFQEELVALMDGKTFFRSETPLLNAAGQPFQVELTLSVQPGYEEDLSRVLVSFVEITDRKKAEDALRASEEKYRTFFENSTDAMLILRNGLFVDCNAATVDLLRYDSKEELLDTPPSDLSPEFQPDGQPSFEKSIEMMGLAFAKGSHRFEWDHIRKDGNVIPVEVSLTAIPAGEETLLHTVWRDISTRKQAEEALRISEERLLDAQKVAKFGHFVVDIKTGEWTCSAELDRIFGID